MSGKLIIIVQKALSKVQYNTDLDNRHEYNGKFQMEDGHIDPSSKVWIIFNCTFTNDIVSLMFSGINGSWNLIMRPCIVELKTVTKTQFLDISEMSTMFKVEACYFSNWYTRCEMK